MANDDGRIVPERDEALSRARKGRGAGEGRRNKSAESASRAEKPRGRVPLFVYVLLLVSFAASGYLYYQTQQLLNDQSSVSQRVAGLESRLSVTDESLSESGAAMQALLQDHDSQLETHMSEIRKLWGVSYDTNRTAIDELKSRASQLEARSGELAQQLDAVESLPGQVEQATSRLDDLASQVLILSADLEEALALVRDTRDEINTQGRALSELRGQSQEHAEAIDSIDAFRGQINQRLQQLESELRALSGGG